MLFILALLIDVLLFDIVENNIQSWFSSGSVTFQLIKFVKLVLIMYLASVYYREVILYPGFHMEYLCTLPGNGLLLPATAVRSMIMHVPITRSIGAFRLFDKPDDGSYHLCSIVLGYRE